MKIRQVLGLDTIGINQSYLNIHGRPVICGEFVEEALGVLPAKVALNISTEPQEGYRKIFIRQGEFYNWEWDNEGWWDDMYEAMEYLIDSLGGEPSEIYVKLTEVMDFQR